MGSCYLGIERCTIEDHYGSVVQNEALNTHLDISNVLLKIIVGTLNDDEPFSTTQAGLSDECPLQVSHHVSA